MTNQEFIKKVYEIAFGHDAINRNFSHAEVIEQLEEYNEDSLKWDIVNDYDKEFYEKEFYDKPAKEGVTEWKLSLLKNHVYLLDVTQ